MLCFHGQPVSIPKLIVIDLAEYQRPLSSPQIENTRREPSREEKRLLVFFCLFSLFRLEFMIIQISIFSFFLSLRPSNEYIEKKSGLWEFYEPFRLLRFLFAELTKHTRRQPREGQQQLISIVFRIRRVCVSGRCGASRRPFSMFFHPRRAKEEEEVGRRFWRNKRL